MNRSEVFTKVEDIFKDLLDDEDFSLSEEDSAKTIKDWDSLFHITLIASIEEEFGIRIATTEIAGAKDIGALIDLIEKELKK